MRLIIAGGGTGGHLFPGIAVAEEFLARGPENQVLFVGTANGIEARAVPASGYSLELISAAGIRGKGGLSQIRGGLMMLKGLVQSCRILRRFKPDMVLGVGGYASLPMLLAARLLSVPSYVHEQNAIPGKTNRLLSGFVDKVFLTLEESGKYFKGCRTVLTGNPLRRQILDMLEVQGLGTGNWGSAKDITGQRTPDNGQQFHLLVFGGSQGAHAINMAMVAALPYWAELGSSLRIVHQTGEKDLADVCSMYRQQGVEAEVTAFIDDMAAAYSQADLIICRAGATTIAELTACGKAALFIPFPFAVDDHQRLNAEALVKNAACFMLLECDLDGAKLAAMVKELMADRELLCRTALKAAEMARLDSAGLIVDEMLQSNN